jgi:integrase
MITNEQLLTTEEYATLVETAHDDSLRHGFTVYLIAETGLRRSEAAKFIPEWLDEMKQVVDVPYEDDEGSPSAKHRARRIPLRDTAVENLTAYTEALNHDAFGASGSTIYDRINRAGEITGFDVVTPSMLRQMYAIRLQNRGVPFEAISEVLGINPNESSESIYFDTTIDLDEWQLDTCEPDIWEEE